MTRAAFNLLTDLLEICALGLFVRAIALITPARAADGHELAAWAFGGAFAGAAIGMVLLALYLVLRRSVAVVEQDEEVIGDTTGWGR